MATDELIEAIEVVVQGGDMRPLQRAAALQAMEQLRSELERLQEVERQAIAQSEYIQTHGLTEYELSLKDAEIKRLRVFAEQLNRENVLLKQIATKGPDAPSDWRSV